VAKSKRKSARRRSTRRVPRPVAASPRVDVTPKFEVFAIRAADPRAAARAVGKLKGQWALSAISEPLGEFQIVPTGRVRPSAGSAWETARALAREPGIFEAEPQFYYAGLEPDPAEIDRLLAPHEQPRRAARASGGGDKPLPCAANNPQWSVQAVKADQVWPAPNLGKGVIVGHPDTGYTRHGDIWNPVANPVLAHLGFDFVDDKPDPVDPLTGKHPGHGTATASVIMSPRGGAGAVFVEGTAPEAQIVPLRVSDSVIHFSFANLTRAIHHAVDQAKVQVISMSLGGPFPSRALERALLHARDLGVVSMAAAGNVWPFVVYPARYADVLAVAATNCQSRKWKGSANGSAVDSSAPGESVWRAKAELKNGAPQFDVAPSSGTSYAVATTAGICALWIAKHGHANLVAKYGARLAAAFRKIVVENGCDTPAGWDTGNMGAGIINAQKVIAAPLPAAATGVRSAAPRGPIESALDYFPMLDPDRALAAITAGIPRTGRQGVRSAFTVAGDELLFQLGTNPQLRAAIHARAAGGGARAGTRAGRQAAAPAPAIDGSRAFRRAFGL
jgi:thermitase